MAFARKSDRIRALDPDVMVIQECEAPEILRNYIGDSYQAFWTGENPRKGLGVFIRHPIAAEQLHIDGGHVRHMLLLRLSHAINLIAFWAMNDTHDLRQRYIGQVWQGLRCCEDYLSRNCIVAGDFNWNLKFDMYANRAALYGTMDDVVALLHAHQLSSAYHTAFGASFGSEPDPTFLMHRHPSKAYHTDYIFLSEQLADSLISFKLGSFGEWGDISDHMPLVVDIA